MGFTPGETVEITLHSTPISLGSATADEDGTVVKTVTIPADVEPGVHTIEMAGQTSGVTVTAEVEVVAAESASDPEHAARDRVGVRRARRRWVWPSSRSEPSRSRPAAVALG